MNLELLLENLERQLDVLSAKVLAYLPNAVAALLLLLAGFLVARIGQAVTRRLVGRLDRLFGRGGLQDVIREVDEKRRADHLVARLVFWLVMVLALTAATETLGLPVVTTWLSGVASYLPRILVAVLIVFAGVVVGVVTRGAVARAARSADVRYADPLARMVQIAVVVASIFVAVDQVGIETGFLSNGILVVLAALLGAAALAFGLGARTLVSNILAAYDLQKVYRVGHVVRCGEHEGRIVRITQTSVVLDATEGQIVVPAHAFTIATTRLVARETA